MDDWNFKQVVGVVLMFFSGLLGLIAFILFLFMFLRAEVAGGILLVLMMIAGIWLWKSGSKENN